jgi:hypothetical protein
MAEKSVRLKNLGIHFVIVLVLLLVIDLRW